MNASCASLLNCVRTYSNAQNAFSVGVNAISMPEKLNARLCVLLKSDLI